MTAGLAVSSVGATAKHWVPTGAKIEASGYGTIERAPSSTPQAAPPQSGPQSEEGWYAQSQGLSVEEARKRLREQNALAPEIERVTATLNAMQKGNYTSLRLEHQPDWRYVFYFKREPQKTLAKYTRHPRFEAALARHSREELDEIIKPWTDRFKALRLTGGWGTDDTLGTAEIMMNVTEDEYRGIALREGWGPVPEVVRLKFAGALRYPSVDQRAGAFVRIFAQNDRSTGVQLAALGTGRIVLKDGCLYVEQRPGSPRHLAYFHRETGLGVDQAGYLAFIDRRTGKPTGRIGETFTWGGPNAIAENMAGVRELRALCGNAPLSNVGNPQSARLFEARTRR